MRTRWQQAIVDAWPPSQSEEEYLIKARIMDLFNIGCRGNARRSINHQIKKLNAKLAAMILSRDERVADP